MSSEIKRKPGMNLYANNSPLIDKTSKLDELEEKSKQFAEELFVGVNNFMTATTAPAILKASRQIYLTVVQGYTPPTEASSPKSLSTQYGTFDITLPERKTRYTLASDETEIDMEKPGETTQSFNPFRG